jgi:hypothetical protein
VGSHGSEDNSVGGKILAGLSAYLACIPDVIPATANATIYQTHIKRADHSRSGGETETSRECLVGGIARLRRQQRRRQRFAGCPLPLILAGLSAYLACIPDVIPATANATIYQTHIWAGFPPVRSMPVKNTTSELDQRDHHTGD